MVSIHMLDMHVGIFPSRANINNVARSWCSNVCLHFCFHYSWNADMDPMSWTIILDQNVLTFS